MKPVSLLFLRIIVGSAGLLALTARAQLLEWNTWGNTGTETSELSVFNDPAISAASLTLGPGVSGSANANRFGGNNWFDTGDTNPTTLAESINGNDYIEFTVAPQSGYQVSITSLVFSWEHSATGPGSLAVRSSADNFASTIGSISGLSSALSTGNSITLTSLANLTTSTTLRLYGYGATGTSGSGGFDTSTNAVNVQLNGSVSAVPEPATYAALAGIAALLGVVASRRRRGTIARSTGAR